MNARVYHSAKISGRPRRPRARRRCGSCGCPALRRKNGLDDHLAPFLDDPAAELAELRAHAQPTPADTRPDDPEQWDADVAAAERRRLVEQEAAARDATRQRAAAGLDQRRGVPATPRPQWLCAGCSTPTASLGCSALPGEARASWRSTSRCGWRPAGLARRGRRPGPGGLPDGRGPVGQPRADRGMADRPRREPGRAGRLTSSR